MTGCDHRMQNNNPASPLKFRYNLFKLQQVQFWRSLCKFSVFQRFRNISYYCFIPLSILILISSTGCRREVFNSSRDIKNKIRSVMDAQVQAWNKGNIREYMSGYYYADSLRFASGGDVFYGWEQTLERYQKSYPNKYSMGFLTFSEIDIQVFSNNTALVFGRWNLDRENKNDLSGLFTLVFQNTDQGWRITHDHTSSTIN